MTDPILTLALLGLLNKDYKVDNILKINVKVNGNNDRIVIIWKNALVLRGYMPIFKGKFVYTYFLRKLIANKKERER